MLKNLLRRAWRHFVPSAEPEVVMGTRPGYVWWPEGRCWADEAESYKPTGRTYALIGPVCVTYRGWLGQEERARLANTG